MIVIITVMIVSYDRRHLWQHGIKKRPNKVSEVKQQKMMQMIKLITW